MRMSTDYIPVFLDFKKQLRLNLAFLFLFVQLAHVITPNIKHMDNLRKNYYIKNK